MDMANFNLPYITEKRYLSIAPMLLTANGNSDGLITVASTYRIKVGQILTFKSTTVSIKLAKVKRVISTTQFIVIDPKDSVTTINKLDMSMFLTADTATVELAQDKRPVIELLEIQRQIYEEEPTVALRSHLVDWLGRSYDKSNPIPVELSDGSISIGTVNAELEVQLSHQDNVAHPGDVHDSVRIGDGEYELDINSDGSINVDIQPYDNNINIYNENTNVLTNSEQLIVTYSVPSTMKGSLFRVEFSGTQIAKYTVYINGNKKASKRTHHGSGLSGEFCFYSGVSNGIPVSSGDQIQLKVLHNRPDAGSFEGRIQVVQRAT